MIPHGHHQEAPGHRSESRRVHRRRPRQWHPGPGQASGPQETDHRHDRPGAARARRRAGRSDGAVPGGADQLGAVPARRGTRGPVTGTAPRERGA